MQRFKKVVAIALTATMVLGCAITAFAGDNDGSSTGAGTSEGHVEKKATNVILPTIAEGTTPFAYTMDPERLINETSHAKYGTAVEFPTTGDTGVYWNNGTKGGEGSDKDNVVYANSSKPLSVINKSSHAIDLTVSVAASSADTDIPLVAESAVATAESASLYLGLIVDEEDPVALSTSETATQTVTIDGTPGNFKTAVESGAYVYRALSLAEYQALDGNSGKSQVDYDATWSDAAFQLEGAVTSGKAITATTTAPTVTVTWSWVDPDAAPAVPEQSSVPQTVEVPETGDITVAVTIGSNEDELTKLEVSAYSGDMLTMGNGYGATYSNNVITLGADIAAYLRSASADDLDAITFTATFGTGDDSYTKTFKFVPAE